MKQRTSARVTEAVSSLEALASVLKQACNASPVPFADAVAVVWITAAPHDGVAAAATKAQHPWLGEIGGASEMVPQNVGWWLTTVVQAAQYSHFNNRRQAAEKSATDKVSVNQTLQMHATHHARKQLDII